MRDCQSTGEGEEGGGGEGGSNTNKHSAVHDTSRLSNIGLCVKLSIVPLRLPSLLMRLVLLHVGGRCVCLCPRSVRLYKCLMVCLSRSDCEGQKLSQTQP